MLRDTMNKRIFIILAGVLIFAITSTSVGAAVYFYRQYRLVAGDSGKAEEMQTQAMLAKIASVMDLPGEKPTIVTITDREKLQSQEFFKKAQNGDKIIIYEAARRVILYRPGTGRVVDVAPLVFNTPGAAGVGAPELPVEVNPIEQPGRSPVSPTVTPTTSVTPISTDSGATMP